LREVAETCEGGKEVSEKGKSREMSRNALSPPVDEQNERERRMVRVSTVEER
jgi:hypothetical protein